MTFIPIIKYAPDGTAREVEFSAPRTVGERFDEEFPPSAWITCLDCGLADWHQTFETLVELLSKCPRCQSLRLKSEIKRRAI